MKIPPRGTELFRVERWTDGQTDMTKLVAAFSNFGNGPDKVGTVGGSVLQYGVL
jgi:hypothetical protein